MSKQNECWQRWMKAAARWLPLLFASLFASGVYAQTSGIAPLASGDCSVTTSGVMTCSKTNGTAFAASATTDTTNAANITSGILPAARTAALNGDVTKAAGSTATTVTAINGLALPTTAGIAAINGAGQVVAATQAQARTLMCSGVPSANYYCDGSTGAWTAIPWTASTNANLAQYSTVASAASSPAMLSTGALYAGGTGTTTTPHWYINQGATAPTTWNTGGTHFGINAASGFSGSFFEFHVNGGNPILSAWPDGTLRWGPSGANWLSMSNGYVLTNKLIQTQATTGGFIAPLYTPSSSSATCNPGTVAWDANYFYVCKATNTWMRSALSSF